jgi:tetratricopeptide (TPR) repeat protein
MPLVFATLALLLAQVGPFAGVPDKSTQIPPEMREQRAADETAREVPDVPAASPKLRECLVAVRTDADKAVKPTEAWFAKAKGPEKAEAAQCLGLAYSRIDRWDEARTVLLVGLDAADRDDHGQRARLGAMAGNAALADGDAEAALPVLAAARQEALDAGAKVQAGDIDIDRARSLVMLDQEDEAADALAEARELAPQNPHSWLFSAALSRRQGKLAEAQAQIEKADELLPTDPEVGLEAGRIAMLAGREDAARKSWQSVVAADPDSDAAATARRYLSQIVAGPKAP